MISSPTPVSVFGKKWIIQAQREAGESLWSTLLRARNIQDPGAFFTDAQSSDLHDPFLFPDMQKAVERLQKAIQARERIVIYGDYDVDGTSGAALLVHALRFLGAEVSYRVPNRLKEGYGLHQSHVDELPDKNVTVLITVDCGISCAKEVASAQAQGIDVILTDHHTLPAKLPPAFATLHPLLAEGYPFPHLSGSGVAFKLTSALLLASGNADLIPHFTDLASLGTVADCVPLLGENRALVKLGLQQMKHTRWDGLRAILENAGVWEKGKFSSETIGFQVGPRINASGRMDDPYWSLQTLLAEGSEAYEKSQKLEEFNQRRRTITQSILEEAEAQLDLNQPLLILAGANWSSGLVGLIAGRLQEKYGRPAFIMEDRGDHLVGSVRSLPGFHAVRALDAVSKHLKHYGGHEQAAGFHLEKAELPAFKEALLVHAETQFKAQPLQAELTVDCELNASELTLENCSKIEQFAPFGVGNPSPKFLLENLQIIKADFMGQTRQHLRFTFQKDGELFDGVAFQMGQWRNQLLKAKRCVVQLQEREWQGEHSVQLQLVDFD